VVESITSWEIMSQERELLLPYIDVVKENLRELEATPCFFATGSN